MSSTASGAVIAFVRNADLRNMPPETARECVRAFVNAVGCMIGGSRHALVDSACSALLEFSGRPEAPLLARNAKTDILHASLINGMAGAAIHSTIPIPTPFCTRPYR